MNSGAKIKYLSDISKFSSSERREKLVFALLSREIIRLRGQVFGVKKDSGRWVQVRKMMTRQPDEKKRKPL